MQIVRDHELAQHDLGQIIEPLWLANSRSSSGRLLRIAVFQPDKNNKIKLEARHVQQ